MELVKLLLKVLYLILLYVVVYVIVKPRLQITGANLSVVVLSLSVLLMYFTFDYIYDFITTNELVIQKEDRNVDTKNNLGDKRAREEVVRKVHIDNKSHSEKSNEYTLDHTHKFIKDKIFS